MNFLMDGSLQFDPKNLLTGAKSILHYAELCFCWCGVALSANQLIYETDLHADIFTGAGNMNIFKSMCIYIYAVLKINRNPVLQEY